MATDIVLLHYNNYFNRTIKVPGNTLADYTALDANYTTISAANFNPADGVSTSLIVGKGEAATVGKELHSYDYLLVVDDDTNHTVLSRWFIIDENNTRDGQYHISLRRDVIIDHYDDIKNAPTFIEKGMISSTTDPLLYNSESMTYNQIKDSETLLKDSTGIGWVVGYIPQDAFTQTTGVVTKEVITAADADDSVDAITNWDYYDISNIPGSAQQIWAASNITKKIQLKTKLRYIAGYGYAEQKAKGTIQVLQGGAVSSTMDTSTDPYSSWSGVEVISSAPIPSAPSNITAAEYVASSMPNDSTLWSNVTSVLSNHSAGGSVVIKSSSVIDDLLALDGTTVLDEGTQILYKIKVVNVGAGNDITLDSGASADQTLLSRINSDKVASTTGFHTEGNYNYDNITVGYSGDGYRIELTQTFLSASVTIDGNRAHVVDAQYDMFCIPYSDDYVIQYGEDLSYGYVTSKALAIGIAEEIAKDAGSGSIYDTQLLPYCPSEELINYNSGWDMERFHYIRITDLPYDLVRNTTDSFVEVTGITDQASFLTKLNEYKHLFDGDHHEVFHYTPDITYLRIDYGQGDVMGAIIWCTSCTRQFDIERTISVSSNALERKVENECDMYRLCSGNYQGAFEFSAAKGYGVNGFRVDCTFKPFNPYIHVVPKLTGLYGANFADFKDARGLICGGDFSLAQMSNAWANYELQNKNYQNIFNRQIENMHKNQELSQWEGLVSAVTGSVTGAMSGASAGVIAGNPAAAIGLGIAGGVASLGAGLADMGIGYERYKEAKSYAVDMYSYQLGNIKAIPTSISKNTALTPNMKIFPFVEKYTCTDTEKQALRDKITYNGMTIMKIGTPSSYVGTGFFKGQIIRFPSLKEDNHMANAIYEEINKGVYL